MHRFRARHLYYLIFTGMVLAGLWWIVRPGYVHEFGRPAQARVIRTWDTNWEIGFIIFWESLSGVQLEVTTLSGETYQVRRYCPGIFLGPMTEGALLEARYDPLVPAWVVVMDAPCDIHNAVFTSAWLVTISLFFLWWNWSDWKEYIRKWTNKNPPQAGQPL